MTTLVQTRQPLQELNMSNQPDKRHRIKRPAAYDEADGDFHFTRGSKRTKTAQHEPIPEDEVAPVPAPVRRKSGRVTKQKKTREASVEEEPALPRRSRGRGTGRTTVHRDEPAPAPVPARSGTKWKQRDSPERGEGVHTKAANGVTRHSRRTKSPPLASQSVSTPMEMDGAGVEKENSEATAQKIALPFSDTPIINRNKEMRRQTGARRSSFSTRGRRASSLIENGHSAIPHREVKASEFYKHIEAEGLSEPRRMRQLLTWCGERALSEKPPHGSSGSNAILGARAIQDQLLKDFASKSEFSDWFSREDVPRPPAVEKPNPINVEHDKKIAELEEKIKRLRIEKKTWLSLKQAAPELPPLFAPSEPSREGQQLPDATLLDSEEAQMLSALQDSRSNFAHLHSQAQSRIQALQSSLEFKVDHLADSVHKVEQRLNTASREADRVLALSAARLREREEREKKAAGTIDMPVMEVLRSLGRILPEGEIGG